MPLYVINHHGVQLFAALYAERAPIDGGTDLAPAAAGEGRQLQRCEYWRYRC
jgi:hypothetical protein